MRSIWKGHIRFSLVTVPVKVYSAVNSAERISFNQVHDGCGGAVGHKKTCKKCAAEVAQNQIVKGYSQDGGETFVIVSQQEIDNIRVISERILDIEGFSSMTEVDLRLLEKPYYVAPDKAGENSYALLLQALQDSKQVAVGKITLRDREERMLLTVQDDVIVLYTLRSQAELHKTASLEIKPGKVKAEELALAKQLIASMTKDFSEYDFVDSYNEELKKLVQTKLVSGNYVSQKTEEVAPVSAPDITQVLREAIAVAQKKQKKKAGGKVK